MIISDNTLYYLFSTSAQVLVAAIGLSAVFVQFKTSAIKKFLIGDGETTLVKVDGNTSGYGNILTVSDRNSLSDAVLRHDIVNIGKAIKILSDNERNKGTEIPPNGFQNFYKRFELMREYLKILLAKMKEATVFSFAIIILLLLSLSIVDFIKNCFCYQIFFIVINLLMTIIALYKIGEIIIIGIDDKSLTDPDQKEKK